MVWSESNSVLQQMLQSAVQSVQWTYSLFWHFCPQQGILVWGDGYYNGAIKTRKTVQPTEVSTEEASLQRSQQLRELYESLSAGETRQPALRPCAALSPEDLTEPEWFYLMCMSFSFPSGVGLPGKAFTRQRHMWLTGANDADSEVFSRAILAKSAHIQTVVCIPLMDGVLELGTTEKVEEDMALVQQAKSFFTNHQGHCPRPALSEHSTSNSVVSINQHQFNTQPVSIIQPMSTNPHGSSQEDREDEEDNDNDKGDEDDNDDKEEEGGGSDSEAEMARTPAQVMPSRVNTMEIAVLTADPSELMQIEMSDGIQLGSPDDFSNNFHSELQMLIGDHTSSGQSDHQHPQEDSYQAWQLLHEDLCGFPQSSGATEIQELSQEDAHYSETVSAVLNNSSGQWADLSCLTDLAHSRQSAFSKWSYGDHSLPIPSSEGSSQWLLKYILFTVPNLHCKDKDGSSPKSRDGDGASRFRKGTPQEELSANHVLAERRRREKLNERFIILRSLVPFVTKMDKASILGDTIEYVKQLRKRIQDLESQNGENGSGGGRRPGAREIHSRNSKDQSSAQTDSGSPCSGQNTVPLSERKKRRMVECSRGAAKTTTLKALEVPSTNLQVSIIETDALLELMCSYRDGLLLKIMQTLDELRLEVTSIQSSSANGIFSAKIRAKVREIHGKRASIVQVKKAMRQIFSQKYG